MLRKRLATVAMCAIFALTPFVVPQDSHAGILQDMIDAAVDYCSGQGSTITHNKYPYNADLHLHAVYKVNVHYIKFDANGGMFQPKTMPVYADEYAQLAAQGVRPTLPLETPSREGKTFAGWALTNNATTAQWHAGDQFTGTSAAINTFFNFSGNEYGTTGKEITLYAVWN